MQDIVNALRKKPVVEIRRAPKRISQEEAERLTEKAKKKSFCRIYSPSGTIFLSVKNGRWSLYFGGNRANPPNRDPTPGVFWSQAAGAYRLRFHDGFTFLQYLWGAITHTLSKNERLEFRSEERALRIHYTPENRALYIRYIDNVNTQSTIFALYEHHILDLYLGMLAGFRFMMCGRFASNDHEGNRFSQVTVLESFPLGKRVVSVILRERMMIIRNATVHDDVFRAYRAHGAFIAHMYTAYLYRCLHNMAKFGEHCYIGLPMHQAVRGDDNGTIFFGQFRSDFSKINTPFNVAVHMATTYLVDGLPTNIYR